MFYKDVFEVFSNALLLPNYSDILRSSLSYLADQRAHQSRGLRWIIFPLRVKVPV